ncbi:MAG: Hpt domain-containing protein [Planctomycetota bacterium]|nr:MAG: Hpt domain-containing protein [Planctomycetota bacterium]
MVPANLDLDSRRHGDATAAAEGPVCNLSAALERLNGDEELLRLLIGVFHEDAPQLLAQAAAALQEGDLRTVERTAHSLKGLAANFDGAPAREAALAVELLARSGCTEGLMEAVEALQAQVSRLRRTLSR